MEEFEPPLCARNDDGKIYKVDTLLVHANPPANEVHDAELLEAGMLIQVVVATNEHLSEMVPGMYPSVRSMTN